MIYHGGIVRSHSAYKELVLDKTNDGVCIGKDNIFE